MKEKRRIIIGSIGLRARSKRNLTILQMLYLKLISLSLFFLVYTGNSTAQDIKQIAEKVYLHTDRNQYISGEDIWFKAYVIDPATNKLSLNTNNLHVEMISPDSRIILNRIIRVEEGTGNGDFSLNDSIPSGVYRIRAYTNHMRNYDDKLFFMKEINVLNPYENEEEKPEKKIANKIDISFYPEGGSLIDNVTSAVAFKAVNALGKGCDVTVELYSSAGELMTIFNSSHLGMGFFNLKPVSGEKYYTIVKGQDGTETKAGLPQSFPSGVAIRTFVTPEKNLILNVNTNDLTLPSVYGHEFSVNLSSRGLINRKVNIRIDSLMNNYLIPLDSMPEGILKVTISEFEGLPLAERLFFLQRNDNVRLNVITDKPEYKPREKVTASISLSGDSTFTGRGEFSLSVAEDRFTDGSSLYPRSITSWFLLESDVHGPVEDPSYYFDPDNSTRFQDLDLLLMTQGWRDFQWKYDSHNAFGHEIGFTLSGEVRRIVNNNPIAGIKINLGLFSANSTEFLDTKTDKAGKFRFDELNIYGKARAFVSSTGKFENIKGRISVHPVKYNPPEVEKVKSDMVELTLIKKDYSIYRQEVLFKLNTLKKYKLSDTVSLGEVFITARKVETPNEVKVRESRKIYNSPDKELIIPEIAENYPGDVFNYLSGRISGVRVVRGVIPCSLYYPDDVQIYIRGQYIDDFYKCPDGVSQKYKRGALILLDGYEIDQSTLASTLTIPMNAIDRIDVLNASPLYGMRGANGVVNIITRTGIRRDPVALSPNSVYASFQGFDIPRIFYSPKYDNKTELAFAPDYRSTLFWEPVIEVEKIKTANVEYYNADNPALITISIEGVTVEGIPISGRLTYKVL